MKDEKGLEYRAGDNLDFYISSGVIYDIVMENIKEDLGSKASAEDCVAELRRLCETSVRHYKDCVCAICR